MIIVIEYMFVEQPFLSGVQSMHRDKFQVETSQSTAEIWSNGSKTMGERESNFLSGFSFIRDLDWTVNDTCEIFRWQWRDYHWNLSGQSEISSAANEQANTSGETRFVGCVVHITKKFDLELELYAFKLALTSWLKLFKFVFACTNTETSVYLVSWT